MRTQYKAKQMAKTRFIYNKSGDNHSRMQRCKADGVQCYPHKRLQSCCAQHKLQRNIKRFVKEHIAGGKSSDDVAETEYLETFNLQSKVLQQMAL